MSAIVSYPLLAILLAALAAPQNEAAKPADPPKAAEAAKGLKVSNLSWLVGHWQGNLGEGIGEEIWTEPRAGAMMGMFRLGTDKRTAVYEFLLIEESDAGVHLRSVHYGPKLTPANKGYTLPATRLTANEVAFEDPQHADVRAIIYKKTGPDSVSVELHLVRNGEVVKSEAKLDRKK